jgi:hypothetical protein
MVPPLFVCVPGSFPAEIFSVIPESKVIPVPVDGCWTIEDLCDSYNLPRAGDTTPDNSARNDMRYLFTVNEAELKPYELLQKQELQKQLGLLNEEITSPDYAKWHVGWRSSVKRLQDQGGKYTTNLSMTAIKPCTGIWLTNYATNAEKDYKCPCDLRRRRV